MTTHVETQVTINNLWHSWEESQGVFKGQLFDLTNALGKVGWKVDAGDTSNCQSEYKLDGIIITDDDHMVPYIWQETSRGNFLVPLLVSQDLVAIGNYGTPARGTTIDEAVKAWNEEYPHNHCNIRGIKEVLKRAYF